MKVLKLFTLGLFFSLFLFTGAGAFDNPTVVVPLDITGATSYGQMAPSGVSESEPIRLPASNEGYTGFFQFTSIDDASGADDLSVYYRTSVNRPKQRTYNGSPVISGDSVYAVSYGEWDLKEKRPIVIDINTNTGATAFSYPFVIEPYAQYVRIEYECGSTYGVTPQGIAHFTSGIVGEGQQSILISTEMIYMNANSGVSILTIPDGTRETEINISGVSVMWTSNGVDPGTSGAPFWTEGDTYIIEGNKTGPASQIRMRSGAGASSATAQVLYKN